MSKAAIWFAQAKSDRDCMKSLMGSELPKCHAIAKAQQAAEKAVKALLLARGRDFAWNHKPSAYINGLQHSPGKDKGFANQMRKLFSSDLKRRIRDLENLAPSGNESVRNTEYPFYEQRVLHAPCEARVFSDREVRAHCQTAEDVMRNASKLVAAFAR